MSACLYLQGGRFHFSGQPVPVLGQTHSKKVFSNVQAAFPVFQWVPTNSCPVTGNAEKSLALSSFHPLFRYFQSAFIFHPTEQPLLTQQNADNNLSIIIPHSEGNRLVNESQNEFWWLTWPLLHFPNVFLKLHILTHKKEVSLNASTIKLERILLARDLFN